MGNVRVELNSAGVRELLKSAEMMEICNSYATKAASQLGEGYVAKTWQSADRAKAKVEAIWNQTKADNLKNNTIMKALRG